MKKLLTSMLVASSLLAAAANAQSNLLVAGDFESITSSDLTAYAATTTGVWATESAAVSGAANGITPFGAKMLQLNHAGGGTAGQTNQVIHGPFKAGSVVTFAAKFNTWRAADSFSPQTVSVSVMTDSGVALTGTRYTSPIVALDTNPSTWQTASVTVTLPSDTNYLSAEIILSMFSGALPVGTPLAYVDDAVLTVAPHINWVNWTGTETASGITKYVGNMVVPRTSGGSTTVTVKYTPPNQSFANGSSFPGIFFFQTSNGTDFYRQGNAGALGRNPTRSPYTSAKVGNIPDGGGAASDLGDLIALQFAGTNKLEFFDAGTGLPISIASPVFAYVSLNGNGYGFDQDFDILSFGDGVNRDQGYFGAGSSKKATAVVGSATQYQLLQDTNPLGGGEPHGALQFRGAFTNVTWQSLSNEVWNGFTIGVAELAADVPIANAGPDQTVNATSASGASVQLSGSVSGSTNAPFTFTWTGDFGTATGQTPTVALGIGTHTITLVVTDATGASDSDTVVITVLPNPAPVITSPTSATGTYGSPFSYTITATNSPTSFGAANLPAGLTLSGAVISGTPTTTGLFGVNLSATNSGGTGTATLLLNINKANATVVVTPYNVTYDGNAHTATVVITGVNGESGATVGTVTLNTTHTNAGTYASDSWSFADAANHYNSIATTTITDTIAKANATVSVNGYTGIYDGAAHGATGSATGVGGVDLSAGLSLGATFTDVPGGTASWSFAGGANYNSTSGTAAIVINKADATVTVNGYSGTYDAAAHGATGSAKGVGGVDLSVGLNLGGTFTNAPGGTANWSFAGGTNYNSTSGAATIAIAKANATVSVSGYTGVYDTNAHGASGTATGVGGVDLSAGLNLGATFTDAPGGTANWSFAGGTNYNDQSGSATIVITKADATVTVNGYTGVYDAAAHGATGTANGVGGVDLSAALNLGATFTDVPGGTANWTFTGGTNYSDQSGSATIVITKADATVTVNGYTGIYDATAHGASGTAKGVGGVDLSAGLSLGATFTDVPGGTASWSFSGGTNYNNTSGTASIVINKANATVTVNGYSGVYDAAAHGASGSAKGVGGVDLNTSLSLGATFTNVPGGTASWSFSGGTNYNNTSGTASIAISKANATVTVNGYTGTYDGATHGATGTAKGVGGVDLSAGLTLGASFKNVPGGTANWSFAGGTNYNDTSGSAPIVVNPANATIVVTPYNVEYDTHPHSATVASISGVNGETGATVGTVTLNTTHTAVGTYADSWSFAGANYNPIPATTITDKIVDTTAPAISSVSPSSGTLWPPNHQMVPITVRVSATDLSGVASIKIVKVTSSEPDNGLGDGDTPNDTQITGDLTVNLRAERSGGGSGRTYTITIEARDPYGNASQSTCTVSVVKSQGGK